MGTHVGPNPTIGGIYGEIFCVSWTFKNFIRNSVRTGFTLKLVHVQ